MRGSGVGRRACGRMRSTPDSELAYRVIGIMWKVDEAAGRKSNDRWVSESEDEERRRRPERG